MRLVYILISISLLCITCKTVDQREAHYLQAPAVQLSVPQVILDSIFFYKSTTLALQLDHPQASLRYAKQTEALEREGKDYLKPLVFSTSQALQIQGLHPACQPSAVKTVEFARLNPVTQRAKIASLPAPKAPYDKGGMTILNDFEKAKMAFRQGGWLGFQADTLVLRLTFPTPENIHSIGLSFLRDHHSWIFLPEQIEVWMEGQPISQKKLRRAQATDATTLRIEMLSFAAIETDKLELKLIQLPQLPIWHLGKGNQPWLFLDEILVNP